MPNIDTYIIAGNRLAGEYLAGLLAKDHSTSPTLCEELPELRSPMTKPTVFILDGFFLPIPLGECIRRLRQRYHEARFIAADKAQPDDAIVMLLKLGLHGFIEHHDVASTLHDAVHNVVNGRLWVSTDVLQRYASITTTRSCSLISLPTTFAITPREAQVLDFARLRLSNKEIAKALGVQESTVKYHLSHIFQKLHIGSRCQLEAKRPELQIWDQLLSA